MNDDVVYHFATKTNRTLEHARKVLAALLVKAIKHGLQTKTPSNSDYGEVGVYRDPSTGHTIWVKNDQIVNVIVAKKVVKQRKSDD